MNFSYFVPTENVLGVRTNLSRFPWSFAINAPASTKEAFEACKIRITLHVTEDFPQMLSQSATRGRYHYFSSEPGSDEIYYERQFFFGKKLRLFVKGLLTNDPVVYVNPTYYRFVSHRVMNLHSVGYILTDMTALLLLRNGLAPLHCSAFRLNSATVVVLAPPNTGKTLSTMMACMEHDAYFISEDLAITDGKSLYSVPWTSTFRYYSKVEDSPVIRFKNRLTSILPVLELVQLSSPTAITKYVDETKLLSHSDVTHVVLLERGASEVVREDRGDMARKAINLNRYEFNYLRSPVLTAYEFFNPELSVNAAYEREQHVLRKLVATSRDAFVVRSENAMNYTQMIFDAVKPDPK